jgi:hypothetical protein
LKFLLLLEVVVVVKAGTRLQVAQKTILDLVAELAVLFTTMLMQLLLVPQ